MSDDYTIYAIRNIETDQRYVGIAKNFHFRKGAHLSKLRQGRHDNHKLQKAFNIYGHNGFAWEIVEKGLTGIEAAKREHHWIARYKCLEDGYNISEGMYCISKESVEIRKDPRSSWASIRATTELKSKLRTIALEEGLVPDYYTEKHSPLDLGVMDVMETLVVLWGGLSHDEKRAIIDKTPKPKITKIISRPLAERAKLQPSKVQIIRNFEIDFICDECKKTHRVEAITYGNITRYNLNDYLSMYKPFCCEECGADGFKIQAVQEKEA